MSRERREGETKDERGARRAAKKAQKAAQGCVREKTEKEKTSDGNGDGDGDGDGASGSGFSLLADNTRIDSALSSLFAVKQPPVKANPRTAPPQARKRVAVVDDASDADNDADLSELDEDLEDGDGEDVDMADDARVDVGLAAGLEENAEPRRKRKRKDAEEQLEDAYMSRLVREEERDAERQAAERVAKRAKKSGDSESEIEVESAAADVELASDSDQYETASDGDEDVPSSLPKHETVAAKDAELDKANRTVFVGNVSTTAISSKAARKTLLTHLASFFPEPASGEQERKAGPKPKVESLRFRSTPYASAIPKKAAYAKKELMDATSKSTNAYVVYSTPSLAREACQHLNGTLVLDRHLRIDSIAHPAKVDNRRCVFVGNLGFVDDESNIQEANEEDGREKRKRGKEPADIEEGLWRSFAKCGTVESVRVIRDSTTRVGKGIAYVQFEDENAVEAALLLNEKKFPPMLPRKLRVSRAKAPKKNAKAGSGRPSMRPQHTASGYQRKITGEEASRMGRSAKLLGRAAAANMRKGGEKSSRQSSQATPLGAAEGIKRPENFIFEGHRASARSGKSGLKLGGKAQKSKTSKVTKRSSSYKDQAKKKKA